MKIIVNGTSYDTDEATYIASADHGHPSSQAFWSLYQMPSGAFFEVIAGHDGVFEELNPLPAHTARAWLERHANQLVENIFGVMPQARPPQFSRRTGICAIELMDEHLNQTDLTRTILKWGQQVANGCESGSVASRCNDLIKFLDENPNYRTHDGELLQDMIVYKAIELAPTNPGPYDRDSELAFVRSLKLDGFSIREGDLIGFLPEDLNLPQTEDDITRLLKKYGFATLKGHLDQALTAHGRGDWAAANSQLRAFYEGLFEDIALKLEPVEAPKLSTSENRRALLAKNGFLRENLNEWGNDGKNYVNGLFKRLHGAGSHPGLSDEEDSTFRRHVVLVTAKLFLVRFDSWPGKP